MNLVRPTEFVSAVSTKFSRCPMWWAKTGIPLASNAAGNGVFVYVCLPVISPEETNHAEVQDDENQTRAEDREQKVIPLVHILHVGVSDAEGPGGPEGLGKVAALNHFEQAMFPSRESGNPDP